MNIVVNLVKAPFQRTISPALLVNSVLELVAIPTSACFKEGASFMPSPT